MPLNNIKNLLQNKIGLNADTVGTSSIERAISQRMANIGMLSASDYYSLIKKDQAEFEELVEEVVVPETWFFRNRTPFEALSECVLDIEFLKENTASRQPLRILSLPCATGEEPYSIAMALISVGLSDGDFHVDGIDVSKRALMKARRGIYGQHSFREDGINIQDKFFNKTRSGYQISSVVKNQVSFIKANIIADNISPRSEYYDIIFCRNLLIYFSRETQNIVLDKLRLLLKSGGFLFVGHAETAQIKKEQFSKVNYPKAFAYKKIGSIKGGEEDVGAVNKLKNIYNNLVEITKKDALLSNKFKKSCKVDEKRVITSVSANLSWGKVEALIDSGHYDEAAIVCENLLRNYPENADCYYYLGLIGKMRGSYGGAESLLKKAIYLSPNHQKALSLSVVLAERRGDDDGAEYFRRREIKARERNK